MPVVVWDTRGVTHSVKQVVAMAAGGTMGLLCLMGLLILLHRRLTHPRIANVTRPGDTILLRWLLVTLLLGLSTIVEIGSESCRERGCTYVTISVEAASLHKKQRTKKT